MNIKTKSFSTRSGSGRHSRRASLVAAVVAASALVVAHSAFAQSASGLITSEQALMESASSSYRYTPPLSFGPPSDGPVLAPAPLQPLDAQSGSTYVASPPTGLIEPSGYPPTDEVINPNRSEMMPTGSFGRPGAYPGAIR
jgi:hypothetical protein